MMKLLFAAPIYNYRATLFISNYFVSLAKTASRMGHQVKIIQTTENMYNEYVWNFLKVEFQALRTLLKPVVDYPHDILLMKKVLYEVEIYKPDVLFVHFLDAFWTYKLFDILKNKDVKVVFHLGIHPSEVSSGILNVIKRVDMLLVYDRSYIDIYKTNCGITHCYLMPFSCDMDHYDQYYKKQDYQYDVSFIGLFDQYRNSFLEALSDFDLNIWSWNINKFSTSLKSKYRGEASGRKMIEIYNRSKIVINIHRRFEINGGNFRLFEIPASRAFQLVDAKNEIDRYFSVGDEIDVFHTPDDLKNKVEYYLTDEEDRKRIAKNGYLRVLKEHTTEKRLKKLFEDITTL